MRKLREDDSDMRHVPQPGKLSRHVAAVCRGGGGRHEDPGALQRPLHSLGQSRYVHYIYKYLLYIYNISTNIYNLQVCVMSNFSKSRVLALQLLTRLCGLAGGHGSVADSLSMLRLKFGEPVRFKFLIGEQEENEKANSEGSFCPFSPDFWHSC